MEFAELTAGRPASFRARIGRPTRRDLTVAVLSATGEPKLGEAAPIDRVAHDIRAGFADARTRRAARGSGGDAACAGAGRHVDVDRADHRRSSVRPG